MDKWSIMTYNKQYMAGRIERIRRSTSLQLERAYRKVIRTFSRRETKGQGQIESIAIFALGVVCFFGLGYWFVKNEENKATMNPDGNDPIPTLSSPPTEAIIPGIETPAPQEPTKPLAPFPVKKCETVGDKNLSWIGGVFVPKWLDEGEDPWAQPIVVERKGGKQELYDLRIPGGEPSRLNGNPLLPGDDVCLLDLPPPQMPAELRKIVQLPSDRYEFIKPNITHHVYKSRVNHFPPISPIII